MNPRIKTLLIRCAIEIGLFSAALNLLLLVPPLYLMQIYDRIIPSASYDTLIYITLIVVFALVVLGLLEIARQLYASRVASRFATLLGPDAFLSSLNGKRADYADIQPLRDLTTLRSFVASRALSSLFDLPFMPVFIGVLYLVHPALFWVTLAGGALLVAIALLNQSLAGRQNRKASEVALLANNAAQASVGNRETIRALGMTSNIMEHWGRLYADSLNAGDKAARANAAFGGVSRMVRLLLQTCILGVGAYLVLQQEMTAAMIFASSIVTGRALQPLDQIIGNWASIVEARRCWRHLAAVSAEPSWRGFESATVLPEPTGQITVEDLTYFAPGSARNDPPLIKRVSFRIAAGESVTLIGPSQAGKSTLARLLVGAIEPHSGAIRIDGADIRQWDPERLGKRIGYLSQDCEIFPGTVGQNISRFDLSPDDSAVVAAAQMAHAHELILAYKEGYGTRIGPGGIRLSGGERQRIGLARALYGLPMLLILDEPNANLDAEGEAALQAALRGAQERGITVLMITHRPSIAVTCQRVMVLREGRIELFGPAKEVLRSLQNKAAGGNVVQVGA